MRRGYCSSLRRMRRSRKRWSLSRSGSWRAGSARGSTARQGASVSPRLELGFTSALPEFSKPVEKAKIAAGALQTVPCGRSHINAPVSFGLLHFAPLVTEFLKRFPNWVAISSSRSAIDGEARGRDVHLPNRALKPTQSANTDEVRCTRNAVRSRARLEWLHHEVQRNSRVARAE